LESSEPIFPTTASYGHPSTPEKQDSVLKSHLMMMREDCMKDIHESLKEIQENTAEKVQVLKEEAQRPLKEL
jgi:hypothetical protein